MLNVPFVKTNSLQYDLITSEFTEHHILVISFIQYVFLGSN
jgi:hypothetical protein